MILLDTYWQKVEKQLISLFKEIYFQPFLDLLKEPLYNSSNILLESFRRGIISLKNNEITGTFNLAISKELSKFASFDKRTKSFKIKNPSYIPNDVAIASVIANERAKALNQEMISRLNNMSNTAKEKFKNLKFDINKSADQIESALNEEFKKLGITQNLKPQIKEKLITDYNKNMELSIVNEDNPDTDWDSKQVERLRDLIQKDALTGHRRKQLIEMIQSEFETSKAKARFLARQETSLFLSKMRNERYIDAGIKLYVFLTSKDNRVVGNPAGLYPSPSKGHGNHYAMHGKICKFSDPTVYADSVEDAINNIWKSRSSIGADAKHPGEAYSCRCRAKAVIT